MKKVKPILFAVVAFSLLVTASLAADFKPMKVYLLADPSPLAYEAPDTVKDLKKVLSKKQYARAFRLVKTPKEAEFVFKVDRWYAHERGEDSNKGYVTICVLLPKDIDGDECTAKFEYSGYARWKSFATDVANQAVVWAVERSKSK